MTDQDTGAFRIDDHPYLEPAQKRETTRVVVDGQEYFGYVGEPLSMTLLANGIRTSRTTAERDLARGYFCGVGRCPDCAMTVDGELNVMACTTLVRPGMVVRTQSGLGSWEGKR